MINITNNLPEQLEWLKINRNDGLKSGFQLNKTLNSITAPIIHTFSQPDRNTSHINVSMLEFNIIQNNAPVYENDDNVMETTDKVSFIPPKANINAPFLEGNKGKSFFHVFLLCTSSH